MPLHNIIIPQGRSPLASSEMFSHHYGNMQMRMIPLREMPLHNIPLHVIPSVLSVILSVSEESGKHISCTLSCPRSFTPPAASFRMTDRSGSVQDDRQERF